MFTENEIKLISGKQTRVNWTSEEISKAFTLRYLSQRAYLYVRNNLKYPLPGLIHEKWDIIVVYLDANQIMDMNQAFQVSSLPKTNY